ncbi:MAG TPA: hypothetical protein PLS69_03125 [Terricaulis sp.]|nr:hypothetical protein [Terricaulis sp.]HRP12145.1 hypothetical protein [Terricaulis sp.]
MSERDPSEHGALPRVKGRLPFEAPGAKRPSMKQSALLVYGVITFGLIALAVYMAVFERLPLMSPWVLAPAIGSLWFVLRLFMIWGSRG